MKRFFAFILLIGLLLFTSCSRYVAGRLELKEISSFADADPDSARVALEQFDRSHLISPGLRARHALLLAQALNRCQIAWTDDSIAMVAVDYYRRFGGPNDYFMSLFYRGTVREEAGRVREALEDLIAAEHIRSKKVSLRFRTSGMILQKILYLDQEDIPHAEQAIRKAVRYAEQAGWTSNYLQAQMHLVSLLAVQEKFVEADQIIQLLENHQAISPEAWRPDLEARFGNIRLLRMLYGHTSSDSLYMAVEDYVTKFGESGYQYWDNVAWAYEQSGHFDKALETLEQYASNNDGADDSFEMKYYLRLSAIEDSLGNDALKASAYKKYLDLVDSAKVAYLSNDVTSLEDRFTAKERNLLLWKALSIAGILLAVLLVTGSWYWRRKRQEQERLTQMYEDLKLELASFQQILEKKLMIEKEASAALGERVAALSTFLSKEQPLSLTRVSSQLETLSSDRKKLLETIGTAFALYHPTFIGKLAAYDLTKSEIGYCCLLASGLRTGEIGDILNRSGIYNVSSSILSKFGDDAGGQYLSTVVKRLYAES